MKKTIVYADTTREAQKAYPLKYGEAVGHRAAKDFKGVEDCDDVVFVNPYPEIKKQYDLKSKK